jgi:hypothetical protein
VRVALVIAGVLCAVLIGSTYLPRSEAPPSKKDADAAAIARSTALMDAQQQAPHRMRGTWLAITYGGNGLGEIEPCG